MQQAIKGFQQGKFRSMKAATQHYNVSYDVTRARARGVPTKHTVGGKNKRLSDAQDTVLKRYCERCILAGAPPERKHIVGAANSILRAAGQPPVSKPWTTRWLQRNPHFLHKRKSKPLAAERKAVHELTEIQEHFRRFKRAVDEYKIKLANCWNFDETGWRVGCL
jgi:Tc5 transposase DNA-binding domain